MNLWGSHWHHEADPGPLPSPIAGRRQTRGSPSPTASQRTSGRGAEARQPSRCRCASAWFDDGERVPPRLRAVPSSLPVFQSQGLVAAAGSAAQWRVVAVVPPGEESPAGFPGELVVGTVGTPGLLVVPLNALTRPAPARKHTLPDTAVQVSTFDDGGSWLFVCRRSVLPLLRYPPPPCCRPSAATLRATRWPSATPSRARSTCGRGR